MFFLEHLDWKKVGIFAAGVAFGTVGVAVLSSKEAKKVYTKTTAAALKAKNGVMKKVTVLQENCEDIYRDAMAMNEQEEQEEAEQVFEDAPEEETENKE